MPGSATAHHPPFGQASLARVRLVSCSHPRSSRYAELLCILRVQSLPASEVHRLGTNDAAEGGPPEQVIQNIEAKVPPGSTHRDEAAIDVGPQRQPRAATNGFELPPHIEATPVVLEHLGSVGSAHPCFGDVPRGGCDRGEGHPGSHPTP